MADDWAKKYIEEHGRKRAEKERETRDAQARQTHAEAGGSGKFQQIRKRVAQDVRALNGDPDFRSLEYDGTSGREFTVISRESPRVELKVSLSELLVSCEYMLFAKEDPKEPHAKREPKSLSKTLRIRSDLGGNVTVAEDGVGEVFVTDAEVSDFLLRPLLNHINS
jgi:hypothetical protein